MYATVFMTGAAVMVIELLGTRLIAPFYGTSLYVWSSLISVTMMALASGYFFGGWIADRNHPGSLSWVIMAAGLLTIAIPTLTRPILLATDPLGLRWGAFVSAFLLFTPPLMCLGMVGPIAIQRLTRDLSGVGGETGGAFAVSTVGSVFGTLLLGFYLFPLLGSRQIVLGTGTLLMLLGLMVGLFGRRVSPVKVLGVMGAALLLAMAGRFSGGENNNDRFVTRMERESLYGWVRVIDDPVNNLRLLASDASVIGAGGLTDGLNRLTYQQIVGVLPLARPELRKALLVGQGAGHMAMMLRDRYGITTDTIEIDPEVARAAREFYGFVPTGQALVEDGRYAIRHLSGPYDLIIHDCFTGGSEPAHLLTREALVQLRERLSDRGLLALNFVAFRSEGKNQGLTSVVRTVSEVLPYVKVYRSEPDNDFNDFIILASNQPVDLAVSLPEEARAWLAERETRVDSSSGILLTDDFNPIESLQVAKAENYRNTVLDWLGRDQLLR